MFGLSGHWLACIWYAIGKSNMMTLGNNKTFIQTNWLVRLGMESEQPYYYSKIIPSAFCILFYLSSYLFDAPLFGMNYSSVEMRH